MKNKIITTLTALVLTLVGSTAATSANHVDLSIDAFKDCLEISQYFDPDLPGNQQPISGNTQYCDDLNHHEAFPGPLKQSALKPENFPEPNKNSKQPMTLHGHNYFHISEDEVKTINGIQYAVFHQVLVDAFEIQLEDDFMDLVDEGTISLNSVICSALADNNNCNGNGSKGLSNSGKQIQYNVTFDKQNGTIKWTYPGSPTYSKPQILPIGSELLGDNADNIYAAALGEKIKFSTTLDDDPMWSATTTSRIKIQEWEAKIPLSEKTGNWEDKLEWESTGDFFWFPIGTVTTVWQQPEEPPKIPLCKDFEITQHADSTIGGKTAHQLSADFDLENVIFLDEEILIKWTSDDPNAKFYKQDKTTLIGTGSATSSKNEKIFYVSNAEVNATIVNYPQGLNVSQCSQPLTFPPEDCELIKIDHPKVIYDDTVSWFRAKSFDESGNQFSGKIKYSVKEGHGYFLINKPNQPGANPSPMIYETVNINLPIGAIDLTELQKVPGSILLDAEIGPISDFVIDNLFVENTQNDYAWGFDYSDNSDFFNIPSDDGDQAAANYGMANILGTDILDPDLLNPGIGDIPTAADLIGEMPILETYADLSPFLFPTTITVDAGTKVYFVATKPGEDVITVDTLDTDNPDCERKFSIEPYNICKQLKVNYQNPIFEKRLSEFNAKGLNTVGKDFNGKITYTVDEGYGTFYTFKPQGLQANESPFVIEFDATQPINVEGQAFCSDETVPGGNGGDTPDKPEDAEEQGPWGWKLAPNVDDTIAFINGSGAYNEAQAVKTIAANNQGFYVFYRGDQSPSGNWSYKKATTEEDTYNFLNRIGAYTGDPKANVDIAYRNGSNYIFYSGTDKNADWGWKKSTSTTDMKKYLGGENPYSKGVPATLGGDSSNAIYAFYRADKTTNYSWGWKVAYSIEDAHKFLNGLGGYTNNPVADAEIFAIDSETFYIYYTTGSKNSVLTPNLPTGQIDLIPKVPGISIVTGNKPIGESILDIAGGNTINVIETLPEYWLVPEWVETGLIPDDNPPDPNPIESNIIFEGNYGTQFSTPIFDAENFSIYENYGTETGIPKTGTGGSFDPTGLQGFNLNPKHLQALSILDLNPGILDKQAIAPDLIDIDITKDAWLGQDDFLGNLANLGVQMGNSITVNPGQKVYFWAKKPGDDVIHVKANCTTEKNCERDFDITPLPQKECKAASFFAADYESGKALTCLDNGVQKFAISFYEDAAKTKPIDPQLVKVKWSSTDPRGKFYEIPEYLGAVNPALLGHNSPYTGSSTVIYVGGGQVTSVLAEISGKPYSENICKAQIEPCVNDCADLGLTSTPGAPLKIGQDAELNLNPKDLKGNPLPTSTKVKWSTDTGGTFTYSVNNANKVSQNGLLNLTTGEIPVKFTGSTKAGNITVELSDPNDPLYSPLCKSTIPVVPEVTVCKDLTVTANGSTLVNLKPSTIYDLAADASYTNPPTAETVAYSSNQGVFVTYTAATKSPLKALMDQTVVGKIDSTFDLTNNPILLKTVTVPDGQGVFFITFNDATGNEALTVQATGRSEAQCIKKFPVVLDDQICKSIKVDYFPTPFKSNQQTVITVSEGDFGNFNGKFRFSTSPADKGKFHLPGKESEGANPKEFTIAEAASGIVYTGSSDDDVNLTIEAVGPNSGTNCKYLLTSKPEQLKCEDLNITDVDLVDEDDDELEYKVKIDVDTDPAGFANQLKFKWEVLEGDASFDTSITDSDDNNPKINNFTADAEDGELEDDIRIKVSAVGYENVCSDTYKLDSDEEDDDEEKPEIEKKVFDVKKGKWTDTINVAGKKQNEWQVADQKYITYLAIFQGGTSKSVKIKENSFENGAIKSDLYKGELVYQGMVIGYSQNGKEYVMYQSSGFDENRYDDEDLDGEAISDFEDYDEDEDDLEEEYSCDEAGSNDFCIEDYEDIDDNFSEGEFIEFKNLKEDTQIFIVYQVQNNTVINPQSCIELYQKVQKCGEQFDNEIEFEAFEDNDFEDEFEEGDDQARVIAICPYILTREGGDVFFHSSIDTGIDVSACYPVENCEGPCITPEKDNDQDISKSGQGDASEAEPQAILFTPTHDVCKLSNTVDLNDSENPYKDALSNFSSSVCEFRADVAKDWKEKYINEAIQQNIEKIARFDIIPGSQTLSSMDSVNGLQSSNLQSGVYVIDGDLTIEGCTNNSFDIKAQGDIPAAQTYIVQGGDLTIKCNINYVDTNVDLSNPNTLPSAAFIVVKDSNNPDKGNIYIDNSVKHLDGIYMSVNGKIAPTVLEPEYENNLVINGSLIGNVYDLFLYRQAIGDIFSDIGSIVIRYDERILLNTPPGLEELIDVNQLKTATGI